jgi:hypothetical protein
VVPAAPSTVPVPHDPVVFHIGLGAGASYGITPDWDLAPEALFGLRWRSLMVDLAIRYHLPSSTTRAGVGTVTATVPLGSLMPCVRPRAGPVALLVCASVAIGAIEGTSSGVTRPMRQSAVYALAGARIGVEIPLGRHGWWLRPFVDGLAVVTPTSLEITGTATDGVVWTSPPVAVTAGLMGGYDFP